MERWKHDFIEGLRKGETPINCAKKYAGFPLAGVHKIRDVDKEFAAAWEEVAPMVDPGAVAKRDLTPSALEALLWAQVSDKRVAAFFGMKEKEFKKEIAKDRDLTLVYETGRDAGLAALEKKQYEEAMNGNVNALTWLGKQHLGQADKVDHTNLPDTGAQGVVTINNIFLKTLTNDQLEQLAIDAKGIGETLLIEKEKEMEVIDVGHEDASN